MTTTSNTAAQTAVGDRTVLEDAELDAVTGGWGLINFGTGTSSSGTGKIDHSDFRIMKAPDGSSPL
jgi:hypothetical protein